MNRVRGNNYLDWWDYQPPIYGCRYCNRAERGHVQLWAVHPQGAPPGYVPPTERMVRDRMTVWKTELKQKRRLRYTRSVFDSFGSAGLRDDDIPPAMRVSIMTRPQDWEPVARAILRARGAWRTSQ